MTNGRYHHSKWALVWDSGGTPGLENGLKRWGRVGRLGRLGPFTMGSTRGGRGQNWVKYGPCSC